jgi:lipopolysaccharide transport system permease protein
MTQSNRSVRSTLGKLEQANGFVATSESGSLPLTTKPARDRKRNSFLYRSQELFRYRDLLLYLVIRELKARYKNSALGFLWSLLNPLAMMLVFTLMFTVILPNNQMRAYPIFLLCGLLPWNYFTAAINSSLNSIVGNSNLVKKVYFPREILPISSVLAQLVNFLLSLVVLFVLLFVFRLDLSSKLWILPIVIMLQTSFIIGLALMLSAINVYYRDTTMVIDVVILAWFFLTPIFYPMSVLPVSYEAFGITFDIHRLMNILNPMASIINTYRDLLYLGTYTTGDFLLRTAVTSFAVLIMGYWVFIKMSSNFGEEL